MVGNNNATANWNIILKKHDGSVIRNSGITLLTIKRGKVLKAQDYLFDLGDNFRKEWSVL